jgi:hypothetical protein
MTQKRIESTINFVKPTTLTELQSFLGLVNYFRDHIHQHSTVAHPLHLMVTSATFQRSKRIIWTTDGDRAFDSLKTLVNNCPKLFFIDSALQVVLYTDASDYADGAYLCQIQHDSDGAVTEANGYTTPSHPGFTFRDIHFAADATNCHGYHRALARIHELQIHHRPH